MRNTAILGIALLAALAGCGKKEQAPETTDMAPATEAPATPPAAPQPSTPAPMDQHPGMDGTTAPAPSDGMSTTPPSTDGMSTTPPAADGNKAPE